MAQAESVGAVVAREGIEFGVADRLVAVGGQLLALRGLAGDYDDVFIPLHGEHQAHNAAVALAMVEAFLGGGGQPLDLEVVRDGFAAAASPGRLEVLRRSPTILVDAAHNVDGAKVLVAALADAFEFRRLIGVVGVLADKDAAGILATLEPVLAEVVITESSSPRAIPADELAQIAVEEFGEDRVSIEPDLAEAVDRAVAAAEADGLSGVGVVITGSVTLAGDAAARFRRDGPGAGGRDAR
jgi:dihydrofolate synthase/folylpolyglutamate synthase